MAFVKGRRFECVDKQLNVTTTTKERRSKKGATFACGRSPHLSTFAILLASSSASECGEESAYFWVAIGLLIGDCLLCFVITLALWVVKKRHEQKVLKALTLKLQKPRNEM